MDIFQNNKKNVIIAIAIIIILGVIAIVWKNIIEEKARMKKEAVGFIGSDGKVLFPPSEVSEIKVPNEIVSISGSVEKIDKDVLIIKSLFFGEQKIYTVIVGSGVKIQKREMKKEIPKYEEGNIIEPFIVTDAVFADIRPNDNLNIEANENIKEKTTFEAKAIYIEIMNSVSVSEPLEMPKIENFSKP